MLSVLAACGGGSLSENSTSVSSSSSSGGGATSGTSNVTTLTVDAGPSGLSFSDVNMPFVTITLCDSSTPANCQTIDHVLVDTGSTGLRIMASVLSPSLVLTNETDASANPIGECAMFVSGYSWGPVKLATMSIAGETTTAMPVQIVGDPSFASVPSACSSAGGGFAINSVSSLGAKGLIGVGNFKQDCGTGCAVNAANGIYYTCSGSSCSSTKVGLSQQLPNPVTLFAVDNNGVILDLPSVATNGATSVSGSLIFGIGTESNNDVSGATILTLNPSYGFVQTDFNGETMCDSFVDSGSNGLYFPTSGSLATTLPMCTTNTGFYCPSTTQSFSAVMRGTNTNQMSVTFSVANTDMLNGSNSAFNDIAGGNPFSGFSYTGCTGTTDSFDWGLPFFFGKKVYVAFEGEIIGGSTGPFIAF